MKKHVLYEKRKIGVFVDRENAIRYISLLPDDDNREFEIVEDEYEDEEKVEEEKVEEEKVEEEKAIKEKQAKIFKFQ